MKLDSNLTLFIQSNLKLVKALNIRLETVNSDKKNIGNLLDIVLGNEFFNMIPKAWATKAITNNWDYIRLKSFCTKEIINKMQMQPKEWEKIFETIFLIGG